MDSSTERRRPRNWADEDEHYFCHTCQNTWYREEVEDPLTCAGCDSTAVEIIDPDDDPRDFGRDRPSTASTSPEFPSPLRYADDSDPDEADIDDYQGQHGFVLHRSVRDDPHDRNHHAPDHEAVLDEFVNMIHNIGGNRLGAGGDARPGGAQPQPAGAQVHQRMTMTSGQSANGSTRFTIVTSSAPAAGRAPGNHGGDPFQAIFSNVIRDMYPREDDGGQEQPNAPAFPQSMRDLLSVIYGGAGLGGDAVYSQEDLDRVITNLMDANPQSNAPPPASEEAIRSLERRPVTAELLKDHSNCSICIEHYAIGDQTIVLTCKHWFHEDCVTYWLKDHNSCPICRAPLSDPAGATGSSRSNAGMGNDDHPHGARSAPRDVPGRSAFSRPNMRGPASGRPHSTAASAWTSAFARDAGPHQDPLSSTSSANNRYTRPPNQGQTRLNEAMRSLSSMQQDRQQASASPMYDTSGLQRRTSLSPTSPRVTGPDEHGARMRQRSPSQSSRRTESDRSERAQQHSSTGGGPLSWLRDRFTGGSAGSSGSGSGNGDHRRDRPY